MSQPWRECERVFEVALIEPMAGVEVDANERLSLAYNATKIPDHDRWLFEGEWQFSVSEYRFTESARGVVPPLGGRSDDELIEIVRECLGYPL